MEKKYKESEINVFDLLVFVLQKWRLIIVGALIGAIALGAYAYLTGSQTNVNEATKLTEEQVQKVQDVAQTIEKYQTVLDSQKKYNETSIYHNLNPLEINTIKLDYYVDNNFVVQHPTVDKANTIIPIICSYCAELADLEFYKEMAADIDETISPELYAEVVFIGTEFQEDGYFSVEIFGSDDDMLNEMALAIKNKIDSKTLEIIGVYGDHTITLVEQNSMVTKSTSLYDEQQANILRITQLNDSIKQAKATLTSEELEYLGKLLSKDPSQDNSIEDQPATNVLNIKYAIIGTALGVICATIFVVVKYLFTKKLHYAKEFEDKFGVQYIGKVSVPNTQHLNKFDRKLIALKNSNLKEFALEESVDVICTNIIIFAEKKNVKKLCIISESLNEDEQKHIDVIKDKLTEKLDVKVLKHVLLRPDYMEELSASDAVVFVKQVGKSPYEDLKKELQLCKIYDVEILGSIVID